MPIPEGESGSQSNNAMGLEAMTTDPMYTTEVYKSVTGNEDSSDTNILDLGFFAALQATCLAQLLKAITSHGILHNWIWDTIRKTLESALSFLRVLSTF